MAQRTTQCPECHTTFRVSDVHLQVAKGMVRCGSCLHVFRAENYWVDTPPAEEKPRAVTAVRSAFKSDTEKLRSTQKEPVFSDDDEAKPAARKVTQESDDDMFINLDDLGSANKNMAADKPELVDESWAKDMLDELEDDSAEKEARAQSLFHDEGNENIFADDDVRDGNLFGHEATHQEEIEVEGPRSKASLNRDDILSKIESAPIEIAWDSQPRDWAGIILWSVLCVVAVLGLVSQYAWINFETLARENTYRPLYSAACSVVGCQLPDQFNPAVISIANLVVREDPALPGALRLDAILQNNASYEQPFPDLELYFSDADDFPVASRQFHPHEYLSGEMAGKILMPVAKAIHISMQVVDPGEKAQNHRLVISDKKPVKG